MIRIGTDCSGLDTPVLALRALGIPHEHVFSCDSALHVRRHIEANSKQGLRIYKDVLKRNNAEVEDIDLYVAGFPCQPFSTAGKKRGFGRSRSLNRASPLPFQCARQMPWDLMVLAPSVRPPWLTAVTLSYC